MPSAVSREIDDYQTLSLAFQDVLGVIITDDQRTTMLTKLNRVMQAFELDSLVKLAEKMRRDGSTRLNSSILDAITAPDSNWFQTPTISRLLDKYVLENIRKDARIWVAGCGNGSLAYSIAMDIAEYNRRNNTDVRPAILATDVAGDALERAKSGRYCVSQLKGMPETMQSTYLQKRDDLNEAFGDSCGDVWEVRDKIRQMVSFDHCDLLQDFQETGKVDVIICPHILVYFSGTDRQGILKQFSRLLAPAGILMVGEDQTVFSKDFERVDHPQGVFYRQRDSL